MPLHLLSYFFGGAFLANAIPHLVSGMQGRPFQSPFAKPPGQGFSSATVNVLWGFANIKSPAIFLPHATSAISTCGIWAMRPLSAPSLW